jgi:hypothetical protein
MIELYVLLIVCSFLGILSMAEKWSETTTNIFMGVTIFLFVVVSLIHKFRGVPIQRNDE